MTEQTQTQTQTQPTTDTDRPPAAPAPARPPRDRRVLRAVLRWTAVVAVFAAVGAGTAYGITGMERTDVPGLATASDGRWAYPRITRPPLPAGRPAPASVDNRAGAHYADLRRLLLPAPEGAREDQVLRGTDGWLPTKDFLALFPARRDRQEAGQLLTDYGLRHIAARGWTTGDGTRTRIYLLQFDTSTVAHTVYGEFSTFTGPAFATAGAPETRFDDTFPGNTFISGVARYPYDEVKPYGVEQVRQAYLNAGDVMAVIVQDRRDAAPAIPFRQTVVLESELLA
ncbi:hypothetical protein [Streptomyces similanensis]|uniref:Uncharacterized protein n=1 Tax=Streptomyces similanensis TaxID=1274988 RepID=A0ABP9JZE7_9ACTN